MTYQNFEIHIFLLQQKFDLSRREFPDSFKKQEFYNSISNSFEILKSNNYRDFDEHELYISKTFLDRIFEHLDYLNYNSSKEDFPQELIFTLENALKEWSIETEERFVTISYNNFLDRFFEQSEPIDEIKKIDSAMKMFFPGTEYKPCFVQISMPKHLHNDLLSSVAAYHELGHFIEKENNIINELFRDGDFIKEISNSGQNIDEIKNHYKEYFCDLFAAQYIGNSFIHYLKYINHKKDKGKNSFHPTNEDRNGVVNAFIANTGDVKYTNIVSNLKEITRKKTKNDLMVRYISFPHDLNPFNTCKPIKVIDGRQLHFLYFDAWNCWLDREHSIHVKYPNSFECYKQINTIIKDSIALSMNV